ncbi:hybrid sensor histidine kinase/response regulator transcription factor [Bacteroides sp. 224]|uniref:hybrid sensor histidine kinase/response regulator transcription factor n=1 Tax=Bacteroides sp. 224 TaxID=2302936 RepID=UPI0013CFC873|nr:hybrid sensor histidine kinase/response regulator transcription factor [Bacteroides sp. 224]NDV66274.1 hybrid sensor histidine kinase/response regulator [Bacteroides sp. 224]
MRKALNILFWIILSFIPSISYAVHAGMGLKVIDLDDDMPSTSVQRVFQDSDGLMWFGSTDGLCRYDGYRTLVFRSDYRNPNLLTNNTISYLAEDKNNRLWIGTERGITLMDRQTYTFTHLTHEAVSGKMIFCITTTSDSLIWVGAGDGLYCFNPDLSLRKEYHANPQEGRVINIYEDSYKDIWLCRAGSGILKYNKKDDTLIAFPPIGKRNNPFRVYQDNRKQYWVCTWDDGLYLFDPHKNKDTMYTPLPVERKGTKQPETIFFSIVQDDVNNEIWTVSFSGIIVFRYNKDNCIEVVENPKILERTNGIFSEIVKDRNGNLWIGAFHEGAILINFDQPVIHNYDLPEIKEKLGLSPNITALYEDKDGLLWFTQNRYGFGIYNPATGQTKLLNGSPAFEERGIESISCVIDYVQGSADTSEADMWMGVGHCDLIYMLRKDGTDLKFVDEIDLQALFPGIGHPVLFYADKRNNIWIGTMKGLLVKPYDSSEIRMVNPYSGWVTGITEDSRGSIWVSSSSEGVFRITISHNMDWEHPEMVQYNKKSGELPGNNMQTVAADKEGRVWIGTAEGSIIVYNNLNQIFVDYTTRCGMKGHSIQNLMVDDMGHVWITTFTRITEYNPTNNAFWTYSPSDGLLVNSFIKDAVCKSRLSNKIYFGGNLGISAFIPSTRLMAPLGKINALVTDVRVNNQSILQAESKEATFDFLNQSLLLKPGGDNLEIDFSALNYTYPGKIQYAYKLSGVDNDWVYAPNNRQFATYNQLRKGKYTFQLRVTDENRVWDDEVFLLNIYKEPAYYETWFAYLVYCYIFLLVIGLTFRFIINRIQLRNALKIAQIEKEKTEELTQMKLRYFTNVSHDLLTPLTIISCTIDDVEATTGKKLPQFSTMRSNVKRLRRLLQQILDFRKIESNSIRLQVSYGNIALFIKDICYTHFSPLIKSKEITFLFSAEPELNNAFFDGDKIDKILFNILSNAFKYTPNHGTIRVSLRNIEKEEHTFLSIEIADSGVGIEEKDLANIFTRFYFNKQMAQNQTNGIGLSVTKDMIELHHGTIEVSSKVNESTTFTVLIPIDEASYSADELVQPVIEEAIQPDYADNWKKAATLLLVEDNKELLATYNNILSKYYHIFTAHNGLEALRIVEKEDIDIIVSDVMMPQMDGLEFCRQLKANIETSHIPVLLLTAKSSAEDRIACYNAGADGYISKPFELKVLEARINNFLQNKKEKQKEFKKDADINISTLQYTFQDEQFLKSVVLLIEEHLSEPDFDNIAFAQQLNMSRSSLYRKVKTMTGLSPIELIKNIRLKHACVLLKDKSITISEVAYSVGFTEPKYFSTCFKQEFGIAPKEYQKKE